MPLSEVVGWLEGVDDRLWETAKALFRARLEGPTDPLAASSTTGTHP